MTTIAPATKITRQPGGALEHGAPRLVRVRRLAWRILSVALEVVLYIGLSIAIVTTPDAIKPLASAGLALVIGRLFMRGHDACHGTLFASPLANRVAGRLLFLPSYTAYRLWDLAHNRIHHAFTHFRALDYMWRPMSPARFRSATPWRRALERAYRTIPGHGLYYFCEIYCRKLIVPSRRFVPEHRAAYWRDTLAVGGFLALQLGFYVTAAVITRQNIAWVVATALLLPFVLWNAMMGSATFLCHTDPGSAWFDDLDEWHAASPKLHDTVCLMPEVLLDASRRCKLYDYDAHRWLDFEGHVTAEIGRVERADAMTTHSRW
jgi:omega-6 fatty acid desaturase (delta-12 desaturase)